jgi:hypothetical protein
MLAPVVLKFFAAQPRQPMQTEDELDHVTPAEPLRE